MFVLKLLINFFLLQKVPGEREFSAAAFFTVAVNALSIFPRGNMVLLKLTFNVSI